MFHLTKDIYVGVWLHISIHMLCFHHLSHNKYQCCQVWLVFFGVNIILLDYNFHGNFQQNLHLTNQQEKNLENGKENHLVFFPDF